MITLHDPKNPSPYQREVSAHYRNIRTDPQYRMAERLADLESLQEPAYYQEPHKEPESPVVNQSTAALQERIDKLQAELNYTRNKLNEHTDIAKKKQQGYY